MSIQFKFRSSAKFDAVDTEGRTSISVGELRSKIVRQKNLNLCQGFDLVFSDAHTGHEYNDENFQIPCGSSVIVKRVPAGSVPSTMVPINVAENFGLKDSNRVNPNECLPLNLETDDFGDFGADLCPISEAAISDSGFEFGKNHIGNEKPNDTVPRCQKLEASDLSDAIPTGAKYDGIETNASRLKAEPYGEGYMKSEKLDGAYCPYVQNADLPIELKCSLCKTFFKEAVMIPCCQHSFCEKCISVVLLEKARCPKCYSSKCKVEDLLPNLSLRQAIEHFLESQVMSGADIALQKYAPDGESGIQANDFSCAVTIAQKDPQMPLSPSATERGSNQIMPESVYESRLRSNLFSGSSTQIANMHANKAVKLAPLSHKLKPVDGERVGYARNTEFQLGVENIEAFPDFQGENQPHELLQNHIQEEVDSAVNKKRGLWVNNGGGDKNFMPTSRNRKGDRTCYTCGSPDHLIRDCPFVIGQHHILQTGNAMFRGPMSAYASPFWNSTPCLPVRPYTNLYGNSGMLPLNSGMVPASPFVVPPYMPSMYGGLPVPRFMGMGGLAPQVLTGSGYPPAHSEYPKLQDPENRRKHGNANLGRGQLYDDEDNNYKKRCQNKEPERSLELNYHIGRERSRSYSGDGFNHKTPKKHRHDQHLDHDIYVDEGYEKNCHTMMHETDQSDQRPYHRDRLKSGVDVMAGGLGRYSEERHRHHHVSSKNHDRKDQRASDSSRGLHQTRKEKCPERKRVVSEVEGSNRKHHSHSESELEPSSSIDHKRQSKDKDHGHISSHPRRSMKFIGEGFCHNRWQMAGGSDEDSVEVYQKHRRIH